MRPFGRIGISMSFCVLGDRARTVSREGRYLGLLPLVGLLLVLLLSGCGRSGAAAPTGPPPMPVKVQAVQDQTVGDASEYVATIKSRNSATIMSDVEGWIFDIHVHSGQVVHKGDTLMEIDPRRQRAAVSNFDSQKASKEAALQWAKLQYDRAQALFSSGVVSKQDLDQARANYDSAAADVKSLEAQITQQQVQLKYYSVFAPTDGIIGDIPVHVGDRVTNTTPLTTIDERNGLEVYISIPSEHAQGIRMGAPVQVLDGDGKVLLQTNVYFISPQVESGTQSILVKAPADKAAERSPEPATGTRAHCVEHPLRHYDSGDCRAAHQRSVLRLRDRAGRRQAGGPSAPCAAGGDYRQRLRCTERTEKRREGNRGRRTESCRWRASRDTAVSLRSLEGLSARPTSCTGTKHDLILLAPGN